MRKRLKGAVIKDEDGDLTYKDKDSFSQKLFL